MFGFPLWEEDVFNALAGSFGELQSIFSQYAKSGTAGAALTMQQSELTDLALDCSLATSAFPMDRVLLIFERADALDPAALAKGEKADGALELFEFIEAVVLLAFHRSNPEFGESGKTDASAVPEPLPNCLVTMLKDNLLLNAKRDALASVKAKILESLHSGVPNALQAAVNAKKSDLKYRFEKLAKADPTAAQHKKTGPQVSIEPFSQHLHEIGIAKEVAVTPKSPVKGKTLPEVKTNLSVLDVKGAFVTAQKIEKKNANTTINFDEFLVCLALCGSIKYAEVKDADGKEMMSLADKVEGILDNYTGQKDALAVIQKCFPPPPRFNPKAPQFSTPGKPAPPPSFMAAWQKMYARAAIQAATSSPAAALRLS